MVNPTFYLDSQTQYKHLSSTAAGRLEAKHEFNNTVDVT